MTRTAQGSFPGPARFVTLEGGEGTGKSTQARRLAQSLRDIGIEAIVTREPGGSPGAEAIRNLILTGGEYRFGALTEALLFSAARADHLDRTIRPALERGCWVICDRFADSTRAYQGALGRAKTGALDMLENLVVGETRPDLTLMLDLDAATGLARAHARRGAAEADRFEAEDVSFHRRLRDAFRAIAAEAPERCVLLDASGGEDEIAAAILAVVRDRLLQGAPAWPA